TLILGTPVYFGAETGEMRSFLERLMFPFLTYTPDYASIFSWEAPGRAGLYHEHPRNSFTRLQLRQNFRRHPRGFDSNFWKLRTSSEYRHIPVQRLLKNLSTGFDAAAKKKRREEIFPLDCKRAFDLGAKL